jgi:hypothetical protein
VLLPALVDVEGVPGCFCCHLLRRPWLARRRPLSSEYGTYKIVKAILWPWFSGKVLKLLEVLPSSLESGAGGATARTRGRATQVASSRPFLYERTRGSMWGERWGR